jgi:Tfp pilus assembly protein PilF
MRRIVVVCSAALVLAAVANAQNNDWLARLGAGMEMHMRGDFAAAQVHFRQVMKDADAAGVEWAIPATVLLGNSCHELADDAEAERLYRRALRMIEARYTKMNVDYATVLANLASVQVGRGLYAQAEPLVREAASIYARVAPDDAKLMGTVRNELGEVLCNRNKFQEAEEVLNEALALFQRVPGTEERTAIVMNNLGAIWRLQGHPDRAGAMLVRAVAMLEGVLGTDHPHLLRALNNLAAVRFDQGQNAECEAIYRRALAIAESRLGPDHPDTGAVLRNFSLFLRRSGKKQEAKSLNSRAQAIARRSVPSLTVDVKQLGALPK